MNSRTATGFARIRRTALAFAISSCAAMVCGEGVPPAPRATQPVRKLQISAAEGSPDLERFGKPGNAEATEPLAGIVTVLARGGGEDIEAQLSTGDYEAVLLGASGKGDGRRQFLQLFRRDTAKLGADEREEYAASFKQLLAARRRRVKEPDAALELSAFLHSNRREASEGEYDAPASDGTGQISTRLVSGKGEPVAGRLVYLFDYNPSARVVRVVQTDRSDDDGSISFRNLPSGHYYRVETASNADSFAMSGVIKLGDSETVAPPTMVLISPNRSVSGMVLWKGAPAAGVTVRTVGPDQPMLRTKSDENGFYQFGPLRTGEVVLSFSRTDIHDGTPRFWRAQTGTEEPVVPLDLLTASPRPR